MSAHGCEYCGKPGRDRLGDGKSSVCDGCWRLLRDPRTALPLLRGHMTLSLRGKVPEAELKRKVDAFMSEVSKWRRPG